MPYELVKIRLPEGDERDMQARALNGNRHRVIGPTGQLDAHVDNRVEVIRLA